MSSSSGSAEANAALVRESFEAFNAGDTNRLVEVVSPDLVMHLAGAPESIRGREAWLQGFETMRAAFPDLEARVEDVVAAGDEVAVRVRLRGTHAGEFRPPAA